MGLLDHIRITKEYMAIADTIEKIAELDQGESVESVLDFLIFHKIEKNIKCFYCYSDGIIEDINDGKDSHWEHGTAEIIRYFQDNVVSDSKCGIKKIDTNAKEKYQDYFWQLSQLYDFDPLKIWLDEIGVNEKDFLNINSEKKYLQPKGNRAIQGNKKSNETLKAEEALHKKYLEVIGAMLEERRLYQKAELGRSDRIQSAMVSTIVELLKNTDAQIGSRKLDGIFSKANKAFTDCRK